ARARVEADEVAALVIIPEDFSSRVFPFIKSVQSVLGLDLLSLTGEEIEALPEAQKQQIGMLYATSMVLPEQDKEPAVVEVYGSPDRRISVSVVKSVVTQGIEQMLMTTEGVMAIMEKVFGAQFAGGDMSTNSAGMQDAFEGMEMDSTEMNQSLPISVNVVSPTGRGFNWLDYSATSQAILFLMFAVTSGGRTLLAERERGTLPRLLVTPNSSVVILVGKMAGIVMTGLMQVFLLWGATALIGAWWGPPVAVVVTTIALVLFASGVGALISAWAKTPFQAGSLGTIFSLVAAAISGTFMPRAGLPVWLQSASLITPNAWGIEIFSALQTGHDLAYILPSLGWILLLTVVYYGVAAVGFQRQFR
ncbi:MAG: ABC transporter permease, partial [Anaerolineae bacterium]|nr:ABC transporter permease [Anaerolineae bacterium]